MQAHKGQETLEKKIALLEAHQKEIHDALVSMENHALRLYQVGPPQSHPPRGCLAFWAYGLVA